MSLGIGVGTAGEDGELELAVELFEQARARHPFFAKDEAAFAVTEEDGLKIIAGGFEGDLVAGLW